jgi:hypothetical protein
MRCCLVADCSYKRGQSTCVGWFVCHPTPRPTCHSRLHARSNPSISDPCSNQVRVAKDQCSGDLRHRGWGRCRLGWHSKQGFEAYRGQDHCLLVLDSRQRFEARRSTSKAGLSHQRLGRIPRWATPRYSGPRCHHLEAALPHAASPGSLFVP